MDKIWEEIVFKTVGSDVTGILGVQCQSRNRDILIEIWIKDLSFRTPVRN